MSTFVQYAGSDGVDGLFHVPFPYLLQEHVKVKVNGFPFTQGHHYSFESPTSIRFWPWAVPGPTTVVEISRESSPDEKLANFYNGAVLTADDLNVATRQNFYLVQELIDRINTLLGGGASRLSNGQFTDAQNLIDAAVADVLNSALLADLQSRIADIDLNAESILQQTTRVNTLQTTVDGFAATFADIDAQIIQEQEARVDGDTALASTLSLLGAKSGDNLSFILDTSKVKVSPTESLATRLSGIDTRLNNATAAILAEQTARVNADEAFANDFTELATRMGTAEANIINEQTVRSTADSAFASTLALIGAKNAGGTAFVLNTATTLVDATTSLATRLSGIESKADRVRTFRQNAAPTSPQTGDIWIDTDSNPVNQAFRWSGSAWQSIDNADIAANKAAIINEQTARATADSAIASDVTTLQTTVNGHTASISTQQTVLNGISAQYMVKTDVNGRVAGFGLYNTGATSEFIVLANKFAIVDPANNANVKVPFVVSGGVVYMQNVVIGNGLIESLTVGKLTSGTLTATITQNADINVGTGRIIFDNGAVMLVEGVGFGSSNQFIMWFGPKQANLANCHEGNATFYLKTNGSAYFGGSLTAGTLFNSRRTTDTGADAQISIGPYGTLGNVKTIVVAYSLFGSREYSGSGSGSGPISATVNLYRKIGLGSEVHVATLNVTGSYTFSSESGMTYEEQSMGDSITYSDFTPGTDDRTYRAALVARSIRLGHFPLQQSITLTSTEQ